jgi:hypothetical protein
VLIILLLSAFCGVLLWKILDRPSRALPSLPPDARPQADSPATLQQGSRPLLKILETREASDGTRHVLLTRSSGRGLYYQRGDQETELLDRSVRAGESFDLAADKTGRVYIAYYDTGTGEVRFAVPGQRPQAWRGLRTLKQPTRLTVSVVPGSALLSYYDAATGILYYSIWKPEKDVWRHGTASHGGTYQVVTGRPGAFVLSN